MTLDVPVPLNEQHRLSEFDCGEPNLNEWLVKRAKGNQISGASRTFVVCDSGKVVAFYALAAGGVTSSSSTGSVKRNMPNPVPVVFLARLAVDHTSNRKGIGKALVRDAVLRVLNAADNIGIRALVIHALDDKVKDFYQRLGFQSSPFEPLTLMATLTSLRSNLGYSSFKTVLPG
ncbi:GNAT family N-acetyltransferase [Rouxiella sp. T17]|uniref:GNAT family N-acetyltransferase n=1 Tax=Rouxiella sp. T17 TaxID=3085684 RepID=UPI002FCC3B95